MGFLKRHGKQRTDSTHVLGCVERMSRLELAWETLRITLRKIKATAPSWYQEVIPAAFHESYVKRQSDWRLSKTEVPVALQKAAQDGFWLLDHLDNSAPESVLVLAEVETLRTVWRQQFERREGKTIVRKPPIKGKDVINSPHDPDVRWSKKRSTTWVGYKLQVTETVADDEEEEEEEEDVEIQFITDIDLVSANDGDSEALDAIQERLIARKLKPKEHYTDKGYVSGPNLARSAKRGIELVGPISTGQGNKLVGYRQTDFSWDLETQRAICPAGKESTFWRECPLVESPDDKDRWEIRISFEDSCRDCAERGQCQPGKQGRSLTISAFYEELSARRAEQQTKEFQERLNKRAGVEGTIFGVTHSHGARRVRYRGKAKGRLQAYFTGAAANLKRLARAMEAREKRQQRVKAGVGVSC